jgi:hypothetical protein
MKALTLHHPWALFTFTGWKEVETRDWYTGYRGPLAIHAGRHFTASEGFAYADICKRLHDLAPEFDETRLPAMAHSMGCIVAVCRLAYCVPTQFVESVARKFKTDPFEPKHGWAVERVLGNYEAGRWAWILRDIVPLAAPIPARGYQKLWTWKEPWSIRPHW